ncbi:MAG: hypothetical protein ACREDY_09360, partial [Bradyrhizobium sp.]
NVSLLSIIVVHYRTSTPSFNEAVAATIEDSTLTQHDADRNPQKIAIHSYQRPLGGVPGGAGSGIHHR